MKKVGKEVRTNLVRHHRRKIDSKYKTEVKNHIKKKDQLGKFLNVLL